MNNNVFDEQNELTNVEAETLNGNVDDAENIVESKYESDDNPEWVENADDSATQGIETNETEEANDTDDIDLRISSGNRSERMTRSEYNLLQADITSKEKELSELNVRVAEAREAGDLSENTAFQDLSEKARGLAGDISRLKHRLKIAEIISTDDSMDRIGVGSKVNLVITDTDNRMPAEIVDVRIVSEGFGGIDDDGNVLMPDNSEVYRKMKNRTSGEFTLTGTDGINYHYEYKMIAG